MKRTLQMLVAAAALAVLAACGGAGSSAPLDDVPPPPRAQVDAAVARLDALAEELMQRSGIPGMAVAVVQGDEVLYAKGFGLRKVGAPEAVDADTVFALASMSKPLGATVVATQVARGRVRWDTRMQEIFPWFSLADAEASAQLTIGDLYAHRSGLPGHAGDQQEELGFSQDAILRGLRQLPVQPLRSGFAYTNYGMTAAALAVAARAGQDWASLAEDSLYRPLGMTSTSSRFADFLARPNRAPGHVQEQGRFVLGPEREPGTGTQRWSAAWNTDPQSPSGGVSSSARDLARWMSFVLAALRGDHPLLPAQALLPAVQPQTVIQPGARPEEPLRAYGYGFFVSQSATGRRLLEHGGAFSWGTGTNVALLPSANLGIVVLTNAWPTGVAEALCAQFLDLVQHGELQQDWFAYYAGALAQAFLPQGDLAGKQPPASPVPPRPLAEYAGDYESAYLGPARVVQTPQGGLQLLLGPQGQYSFALRHWDGDVFTFAPFNDAAPPGSVSKADFSGGQLVLEHYNDHGLGVFTRATPPSP